MAFCSFACFLTLVLLCTMSCNSRSDNVEKLEFLTVDSGNHTGMMITTDPAYTVDTHNGGRFLVGDLDGDSRADTAWLQRLTLRGNADILGNMTRIHFSASVPDLVDSMSIGGVIANVEDLDGNGTDEVIFQPDWYTSCWIGITVYGLVENKWKVFGGGVRYRCNDSSHIAVAGDIQSRVRPVTRGVFDMISDSLGDDFISVPRRFTIPSVR